MNKTQTPKQASSTQNDIYLLITQQWLQHLFFQSIILIH